MLYSSDEKQGFDRFFQFLDKFKSQNQEIPYQEKIKLVL